jgi:hypothetical protein
VRAFGGNGERGLLVAMTAAEGGTGTEIVIAGGEVGKTTVLGPAPGMVRLQ